MLSWGFGIACNLTGYQQKGWFTEAVIWRPDGFGRSIASNNPQVEDILFLGNLRGKIIMYRGGEG